MKKIMHYLCFLTIILFANTTINAQGSCPDGSFQWSDISAILSGAGCATANCHGGTPGASGLNMTSYANFTAGGNQCGTSILSGTQFADIINVGNQMCAGGTINNPMNNLVGGAITAQQSADIQAWIDAGAPEMCPPNTCPTVILNDSNLPTLPSAICVDDLLSLCFDVVVDEATFDPTLIQFGYNLTIDGAPSTVTLNTTYVSGGAIDPNATGQLCFEATVPIGSDPCVPNELSLQIIDIFYNDPGCANNFIAYDINITSPIPIMQVGDDLNELIPLIGIAVVQIYPNPNWTATVTQAPACDGATLGIIEIYAADGTLCETLTDIGTAGMDGCPPTDAILPETLYENYTTFTDADGVEQPNPCAVSITIPEQTVACEDQCIICPMVTNVIPPNNLCPTDAIVPFCVEFDMTVDANTVLTVEGIFIQDGSAGGTQICVDIMPPPVPDPCNGLVFDFLATVICDGNDLLAGITWASIEILPVTDMACQGVAGCMDNTACNFNPNAVCDDPAAPCLPAPTCNTDPCVGDTEIIDPNDACACIVDQVQVLGCTDATACNFNMAANCNDDSCDLGNTVCQDPCNEPDPDDGCALTTDTFDAAACTVTNEATCPAGEVFDAANCACVTDDVDGCTDPCDPAYTPESTNDVLCIGYDVECNEDCTLGDFEIWDPDACECVVFTITVLGCTDPMACNYEVAANCDDSNCDLGNTACADPCNEPAPDDGCDLTIDTFDTATCTVTNTPNCAADETFDAANCLCVVGGTPGCLDPCDPNYDADATIDDPALCAGYDITCNTDCLMGDLTIWDAATCSCIVDVVTVLGCTDNTADNYDPAANCDDGSCTGITCEDMIAGTVIAEETGCSAAGIEVTIYDATGAVLGTATTDANGNYALMGVFPCDDYTAELTANIPACYSDSGGITGPIGFTVDGDGVADGANFSENPQVPTLSQWGLMILALLLMTFGALKLGFQQLVYLKSNS